MVELSDREILLAAEPVTTPTELQALRAGTLTAAQRAALRDRLEARDKLARKVAPHHPSLENAVIVNLLKDL